mmetsp:Transcript_30861/g.73505  ORF Transcript_30861/g.73505 Transcript_30861/m.73505 type:complete len:230 (+) Transcript_30861:1680-2369(+)
MASSCGRKAAARARSCRASSSKNAPLSTCIPASACAELASWRAPNTLPPSSRSRLRRSCSTDARRSSAPRDTAPCSRSRPSAVDTLTQSNSSWCLSAMLTTSSADAAHISSALSRSCRAVGCPLRGRRARSVAATDGSGTDNSCAGAPRSIVCPTGLTPSLLPARTRATPPSAAEESCGWARSRARTPRATVYPTNTAPPPTSASQSRGSRRRSRSGTASAPPGPGTAP